MRRALWLAVATALGSGCPRALPEHPTELPGAWAPPPRWAPRFPPAGLVVERTEQTRAEPRLLSDGGTGLVRQRLSFDEQTRFEPTDGGQVLMAQRITAARVDPPLPGPAAAIPALLTRAPLLVELSGDGVFLRLVEPEALATAIRSGLADPVLAEAAARALEPALLEAQARREWETRSGALLRSPVELGGTVETIETVTLPTGEVVAFGVERTLREVRDVEGRKRLVFTIGCFSGAAPRAPGRQAAIDAARPLIGERGLAPDVACTGEQQVDLEPFRPVSFHRELTVGTLELEERRELRSPER